MASQAFRNTVSILALAEGCAIVVRYFYRYRPRNKTILSIVERTTVACAQAHKLCIGELSEREATRMGRAMAETERVALSGLGDTEDITTYSSLVLGLLADLMEKIKDPVRRSALERVHAAMKRLHVYFDRDLDDWGAYAKATRACCVWHDRMGA